MRNYPYRFVKSVRVFYIFPFFLSQSFPYFLCRTLTSLGFTVVRVDAESDARVSVPDDPLYFLDVQTSLKQRRDVCVAELVGANRKVYPRRGGTPCGVESAAGVTSASAIREYKDGGCGAAAFL